MGRRTERREKQSERHEMRAGGGSDLAAAGALILMVTIGMDGSLIGGINLARISHPVPMGLTLSDHLREMAPLPKADDRRAPAKGQDKRKR